MFIVFLPTQTLAQAPHIKFEYIPDSEVFSGEESSTKQVHEHLESFEIVLNLKITLNLDHMLTLEARITYTFSHISITAQGYIAPKIQARLYSDWAAVL